MLYIEELQKYVFRGKKKDSDDDPKMGSGLGGSGKRNDSSYRRPIPSSSEITNYEEHSLFDH